MAAVWAGAHETARGEAGRKQEEKKEVEKEREREGEEEEGREGERERGREGERKRGREGERERKRRRKRNKLEALAERLLKRRPFPVPESTRSEDGTRLNSSHSGISYAVFG